MYNILATKSHKIFEHTELPSLVKYIYIFFFGFFFLHKFYQFEKQNYNTSEHSARLHLQ